MNTKQRRLGAWRPLVAAIAAALLAAACQPSGSEDPRCAPGEVVSYDSVALVGNDWLHLTAHNGPFMITRALTLPAPLAAGTWEVVADVWDPGGDDPDTPEEQFTVDIGGVTLGPTTDIPPGVVDPPAESLGTVELEGPTDEVVLNHVGDSDWTLEPTDSVYVQMLEFRCVGGTPVDEQVRINELQYLGTHNSYHLPPPPPLLDVLTTAASLVDIGENPADLDYFHSPLAVQFADEGIRQIELDIFPDPEGGRYRTPTVPTFMCGLAPDDPVRIALGVPDCDTTPIEGFPDLGPEWDVPGFKVMHIQDIDYLTTCVTLIECLEQIETWSDANPSHLPIAVLIETKSGLPINPDDLPLPGLSFTPAERLDAAGFDALDAEIRQVFDPEDMITPDDVRGARPRLEDAVLTDGWPAVADARGKVMFLYNNGGSDRANYLDGHPSLAGRVMFTNASPGDDDAAFVMRNTSTSSDIPQLVGDGYLVRTRADIPTIEARSGDTARRDAAFASGAQFVSTDYPVEGRAALLSDGSDYSSLMPGPGVARCNPVNAPAACVDDAWVAG